jgi:hypothetical protein
MKVLNPASRAALLVAALVLAAGAAAEVPDEIVVYGTPTELVLDTASLRVDVKQHARSIGRSVRYALGERRAETQVAAADAATRR